MNKRLLGIFCALAIISSCVIYAQQSTSTGTGTNTNTQVDVDTNNPGNNNVQMDMTLKIDEPEGTPYYAKEQSASNPNFRKASVDRETDGAEGVYHYIEDNSVTASENALNYSAPGKTVDENGNKVESAPIINWDVIDNEGNPQTSDEQYEVASGASTDLKFTGCGTYNVHNCGSTQLTESDGTKDDEEVGAADTQTSTSTNDQDQTGSGSNESQDTDSDNPTNDPTSTAQQVIPVKIHDATAPDVWIAFQENDVDYDELVKTMEKKMKENESEPLAIDDENKDLFDKTSFIFIDEGKIGYVKPENFDQMSDEEKQEVYKKVEEDTLKYSRRNMVYPEKLVRVTLSGSIFSNSGEQVKAERAVVHTNEIIERKEDLNRIADCDFTKAVQREEQGQTFTEVANQALLTNDGKAKYGIFVRKNVPLLPIVMYADNGNKRKKVGLIKGTEIVETNDDNEEVDEETEVVPTTSDTGETGYKIYKNGDENDVCEIQEDGTYLFRVANYPRAKYADQPEYYFKAVVEDAALNRTVVNIPVYVVETTASNEVSNN